MCLCNGDQVWQQMFVMRVINNREGLMLGYKVAGRHLPGLSMGAIGLLLQEGQQGLQVGHVGGGGGRGGGP